jgi:hypothetical protein
MEVYRNEGADRPVRLVIPPGSYAPSFVQQRQPGQLHASTVKQEVPSIADVKVVDVISDASISDPPENVITPSLNAHPSEGRRPSRLIITVLVLGIIAAAVWGLRRQQTKRVRLAEPALSSAAMPLPPPQNTIRALMGSGRKPYVDHSGNTWAAGNYCRGGTSVSVPPQKIEGTEDAPLYLGGVRGIAHCVFPVTSGLHEIHFHFAETSDLPVATRMATLSVNAGTPIAVDVVDNAGGDGIATSNVVTGVAPENDGAVHLDFISEVSLLNAVEILPAPSAKLLPVRIVAGSKPFVDSAKQLWTSDRYFSGGRHGQSPESAKQPNLGIYESARIGRFRYNIPAVPLARYRVKLYFREPWFGKENGGPGSRVFDVACNGVELMKNFDILAEGGSEPIVKTFENVRASASGRIELYFMPVVNYPVVNAIELLPED